jgi:EAL domain-containing protein (putative c-di-GMP-specific phosphodiesterase class I)
VSPCQFERSAFFNEIIKLVERSNIPPKLIELEITEGHKIDLDDRVLVGLQKLAKYGFNIAVDDFGMGYTSLRYLKSFPVHTLKIDGSIVRDVNNSKMVQEIIGSMGQLASSMGVNLVAEWVETDLQKMALHELGCDEFQGYLMSPPINLNDFTKYCAMKGVESPAIKKSH